MNALLMVVIADVFIMPNIAKYRPVAITVGRYRDYKAVEKRKWHISDPGRLSGLDGQVTSMFEAVGASRDLACQLGSEVHEFVRREAATLRRILATLPSSDTMNSTDHQDEDDIPF
jgi:hypothetical protein